MSNYCGRFAPSPTGPLHFGSLVSAMSSYLEALTHQGKWLLRIDDVDQTRTLAGMDNHIAKSLEKLGFSWQGAIAYQNHHLAAYQDALNQLQNKCLIYACHCSRKKWQANATTGQDGLIYPDICRNAGLADIAGCALRIRTPDHIIQIEDRLFGPIKQSLHKEIGDFIVRRADGFFAYQLAVVIDDYLAGVTHVVRGVDLLLSTPRQVYLQQQLGYPTPQYLHTPLVFSADGKKLSKSDAAHPVDTTKPVQTLASAWHFLQQTQIPDIDNVKDFWQWAILHWDTNKLQN